MILEALNCQKTARAPIWIMRQAGRYMSEYRELRKKHSFVDLCHTPELAAEVTLQPIHKFGMDAAILFSDILVVAEGVGFSFEIVEKVGPVFKKKWSGEKIDPEGIENRLSYVGDAIRLLKKELTVPLLGFCGAPLTVGSYMAGGIKKWLFIEPEKCHTLFQSLTDASIAYLQMQIAAGVDAVQVFESYGDLLTPDLFNTFSKPYLKQIVDAINVPVILFCKGTAIHLDELVNIGPQAISLDWQQPLEKLLPRIPAHIAIQGNMDPFMLYGPQEKIITEAQRLITLMKDRPGYVFNLGHGILPDIPVENVAALVECVKGASK